MNLAWLKIRQMLRRFSYLLELLILAAPGVVNATTFTVLHEFSFADGASPVSRLVQGSDGRLFGTTEAGGAFAFGTIFSIASDGTFQSLHSFDGDNPERPAGALTTFFDANLYGVFDSGTIYRFTPQGDFAIFRTFTRPERTLAPSGSLTDGGDGNLYGTAPKGGGGNGALERVSANGSVEVVHTFTATEGSAPLGDMIVGSDGSLYGVLTEGTRHKPGWGGEIFRASTDGVVTILYRFAQVTTGLQPRLVESPPGTFYGVTQEGGQSGAGTVFRLTLDGTFTRLHSFDSLDGANPSGGLALGPDGNLYGVTLRGGHSNAGTIFRVTPEGRTTTMWQFHQTDGMLAVGPPVFGTDGLLYGATKGGGASFNGTVFKFDALATQQPELQMTKVCNGLRCRVGRFYEVNWNSTNLDGCVASGAWSGPRKPAGALAVTPTAAGVFTYRLDCTGSSGPAHASVTVTVV